MSQILELTPANQFLTFEDAVTISRQIEDFFNSPESDPLIASLAQKFHLEIRNNFFVHVDNIEKNCKECMGCHASSCVLGCFITEPGKPIRLCFWDEAIEAIIGTKLITHEFGHVIFEQVFQNDMNDEDAFVMSEQFAQFFEASFRISPGFCSNCSNEPLSELSELEVHEHLTAGDLGENFLSSIFAGLGLGIGFAIIGVATSFAANQLLAPEDES